MNLKLALQHTIQHLNWPKLARWAGLFILFLLVIQIFLAAIIMLYAHRAREKADVAFYQKSPHLTVVFTGDSGRISQAISKAQELKSPNIFISGVYRTSSLKAILGPQDWDNLGAEIMDIDSLAQNTVENAIYTFNYLRQNLPIETVLIISHDYHLLRIALIIASLAKKERPIQFYYWGIKSDFRKWRSWRLLLTECWKLLRSVGFLWLWVEK